MKINIYGIGRSGTKAIQLYLATVLAETYIPVRLNYEPYLYNSRLLGTHNHRAVGFHFQDPHLCADPARLSAAHRHFWQDLTTQSAPDEAIISKCIRANGRAAAIDALTRPNFSILVVRKLGAVLRSCKSKGFNLHSVGVRFEFSIWSTFEREIADDPEYRELAADSRALDTDLYRNAMYWYFANKYALQHATPDLHVINFSALSTRLPEIVDAAGLLPHAAPPLDKARFEGNLIHSNRLLINEGTADNRWAYRVNKALFLLSAANWPATAYRPTTVGDRVQLLDDPPAAARTGRNKSAPPALGLTDREHQFVDALDTRLRQHFPALA